MYETNVLGLLMSFKGILAGPHEISCGMEIFGNLIQVNWTLVYLDTLAYEYVIIKNNLTGIFQAKVKTKLKICNNTFCPLNLNPEFLTLMNSSTPW